MSKFLTDVEPIPKEEWDEKERCKAWYEYLEGANPDRIGREYKGAAKAFTNSVLNKLRYNYKKKGKEDQPGRAEKWHPHFLPSRVGKRFTPNEEDVIANHRRLGVDPVHTARILGRKLKEIVPDKTKGEASKVKENKVLAPTLDLILALRYAFRVYEIRIVSDQAYDDMVKEEIEYGGGAKVLKIQQDARDCPGRIKTLALYLSQKLEDEKNEASARH